jgi:hypothetical protein
MTGTRLNRTRKQTIEIFGRSLRPLLNHRTKFGTTLTSSLGVNIVGQQNSCKFRAFRLFVPARAVLSVHSRYPDFGITTPAEKAKTLELFAYTVGTT